MPEQSLLTDEVRALVGRARPLARVQVTPTAYKRALDVYLGDHGEVPPDGAEVPGYVIEAINTEREDFGFPALMPNSILIANEWQFERPLRMGETLDSTHCIVDVSERFGGRFGYSIDFRTEVALSEPDSGVVVARNVHTMTQYTAADARDAGEP